MHNLESLLEKETHTFLWNFAIQTDYFIVAIRQDSDSQQKMRISRRVDFAVQKLQESEKRD